MSSKIKDDLRMLAESGDMVGTAFASMKEKLDKMDTEVILKAMERSGVRRRDEPQDHPVSCVGLLDCHWPRLTRLHYPWPLSQRPATNRRRMA